MSGDYKRNPNPDRIGTEYQLIKEGDWWVARDIETGIASQGVSPHHALEMLQEALQLYHHDEEDLSEEEEREALEKLGIDADEVRVAREQNEELPEFMR